MNKIFLGNRAYGIEAAAQVYYGKSINELDLAQLAMIAGLPKAPSAFNPLVNPSRAIIRRDWILDRMLELDYIDDNKHAEAVSRPITASYHGAKVELYAPYVAEMVRKDLLNRYGRKIYTDGYKVYTTINSEFQNSANQAVINGLLAYDQRHGYRGPEQNLARDEVTEEPAELLVQNDIAPLFIEVIEPDYAEWLATLGKLSKPGDLAAAVVIAVQQQSATVTLLANGEAIAIQWQNGLKDKRRYITVNQLGPKPKQASDVVAIGDVVRVQQQSDGSWFLTQLPAAQAALVSLDADNGAILSLVGGFDYGQSKFNRITQATRQPGSNFKPFVYTAALANGYTPASTINDAPIVFEDASLESTWRPTNDGGKFYGPTRLRHALFKSRNLVSIRLLRSLGISKAINYVEKFGFDASQLPRDLSLALEAIL